MKKITILLTLLLLAACTQEAAPRPTTIPQIEITVPQALPEKPQYEPPPTSPTETGKLVEVKMEAKSYEFLPDEIKANPGDKIKITITSQDIKHKFMLPQFQIEKDLTPGEDTTIEFIADKEGTFTFYCDIPGHEMKGKIIVT